jgi:hypothetical protein
MSLDDQNLQVQKERDEIRKWLSKIDTSERYRKKISERFWWARLIDAYRGYFQEIQAVSDIYMPALNLIFAYVKSEIPALSQREPKIKVNPKKGSSVLAAKILEKALNYIWRTKRIKRETKKNLLDELTVGHSWFKTGYTGKFGTVEDGNGGTYEFIESEDFFGYRVPYENITFNPDANDPPFDCQWIAHEVWVSLEDLKANKSFQNTDNLSPSSMKQDLRTQSVVPADDLDRSDSETPRVKLYEVWNKKKNEVFTITPGSDRYLRAPRPWPYAMKGFPFSFLRWNDDPIGPYGIPDCFMFYPQVIELIKLRASQLDHIKRFNRQLLLAKGHMDDDQKEQFTQGITGAIIEVRTDGHPLGDIVAPIPYPQLQPDIYAIEERIKDDMTNINGQSAMDRGATQKTQTRSLGELDRIQQGGSDRREDKRGTVEDFLADIAGNIVALLQQLADIPFFVSVTGEDPQELMQELQTRPSASMPNAVTSNTGFTFTKEDIQGEFDFEVVPGSTAPLNTENMINTVMELIKAAPEAGAMPGGPFMQALAKTLIDCFDLPQLEQAIEEEKRQAMQNAQIAGEKANQQQQLAVASTTADMQIKAEREATKQTQVMLQGMDMLAKHHEAQNIEPKQDTLGE